MQTWRLHCFTARLGPAGEHDNYAPASVTDLTARGFDIWALGHIHLPAILQAADPFIFYPGNPQGRHPNEQGVRGIRLIDVDEYGRLDSRFIPTSAVVWQRCEVSLTGADTVSQAVTTIAASIEQALDVAKVPCIMRLRLTGRTQLHAELTKQDEFLEELLQDVMTRLPRVWVEQCEVATKPELDLDVLAGSFEFLGEFLRLVDRYRAEPGQLRIRLEPLLADVFHQGNDLSLDDLSDDQLLLWLDEALAQFLQFAGDGGAQ